MRTAGGVATAVARDRVGARDRAVEALLADGWQHERPYKKWQGVHWRLLSSCELGARDDPRLAAMVDAELAWLCSPRHRDAIVTVDGRTRRCASQEGNALLCASLLGHAADPRARLLADSLMRWQWPDGGWNCDLRPQAVHSSFHETLPPLRGLAAYGQATGDAPARAAAVAAADLLLTRALYRSRRSGTVIDPQWLHLHWPAYWHYDVLQGLRGLAAVGALRRTEAGPALDRLQRARRSDGSWRPSGRRYWRRGDGHRSNVDVVDWRGLDSMILTQQARAVLAAAGRDAAG